MNWLALEAFGSLCETLSFTRTAAKLGVTQPNISKLLANLEEELGISLFNRTRKQVSLTPAGAELRDAFVARHADLREAVRQFQFGQKGLAGVVRVGCLPELGINLVFPHLIAFQTLHPGLRIQMIYCTESQILGGLSEGRLDLGICAAGERSTLFRAYPFLTEHLAIWGTPAQIRKLQSGHWERAPWVSPTEMDALAAGFIKLHRKRLPFREMDTRLVANSHRSMAEAVLAEIGFAVMPEASVAALARAGKLVPLAGFQRKDQLHLLMPDVARVPERVKALREHLLALKNTRTKAGV
jgi:DNA-binding transcriptional LysR family regulator